MSQVELEKEYWYYHGLYISKSISCVSCADQVNSVSQDGGQTLVFGTSPYLSVEGYREKHGRLINGVWFYKRNPQLISVDL